MKPRKFYRALMVFTIFGVSRSANAATSVRLPLALDHQVTQLPRECLKRPVGSCAIATSEHQKYLLKLGSAKIWLDENTSIVRVAPSDLRLQSQSEVRLLKGTIWVQATTGTRVSSEFGAFFNEDVSEKEIGEYWVSREGDRIVGASIHQPLRLQARGSKEILLVPEGLQNWMGRVGDQGEGLTGVPMPIVFADHVGRWARLFPGKAKDFEPDVEKFHELWIEATHLSAEINQTQFERKMASIPIAAPESGPVKGVPPPAPVDPRKRFNEAINALFRHKYFSGE